MADEWLTVPLGELYEFSSGLSKPRSAFGSGFPFLGFKDVFYNSSIPEQLTNLVNSTEQERTRCSIKRGDVFLTRTSETMDELGMSCVALRDVPNATFNGFTKRLRPKHSGKVVPEYARYYFRGRVFRDAVTAMSSLSTRASLNNEMLGRLHIVLPPWEMQELIGRILGALDNKIELNRRMSKTLEAMARAFFKSWFVKFDAFRAEAADLIRDGVLEIGDGYRAKNSEIGEPGLPFIRAGNLSNGLDTRAAEVLRRESVAKAGRKRSRPGDVAFTSKGTIGRFAHVTEFTQPFVYSPQVCFWRSLDWQRLQPAILYCWMQSEDFKSQIDAVAGQTDMAPYVSLRDQRRMKVPVFPKSQEAIAQHLDALFVRQALAAEESRVLAALRDTLLHKLISGEVRVGASTRDERETVQT